MLRFGRTVQALGVTLLMVGCDNPVRTPISPSASPPVPAPTPQRPVANGVLSGVISEVTASGRIALEGATIYLMTCGRRIVPMPSTARLRRIRTAPIG
jgi:hypothetical protein